MALVVTREHTDAIIARLGALGLTVGDAEAPSAAPPYVVVYPVAGGSTSGVLAAPDDDAVLVYQVTCVGTSRKQTEWLADKVIGLLTGVTVTARKIPTIHLDSFGGVTRDDTSTPPLYLAFPRFRVYTTPA